MVYTKEVVALVWLVAAFAAACADDYNPGLEAKDDMLSAQMRQLEKQNSDIAKQNSELGKQNSKLGKQNSELEMQISELAIQLKKKDYELERMITNMQTKADSGTSLMFDCYLTSDWEELGPIRFSGCEGKDILHT